MSAAGSRHDRAYDAGRDVPPHDRSIGGLFGELAREAANLARSEIELAKAEVSEKVGSAAGGAGMLAAGGLIAFAGLIFLLASATIALSLVVEPWLAALIVGAVVAVVGVVVVLMGRSRLKAGNLAPRRTLDTLRDDKRWAESQLGR